MIFTMSQVIADKATRKGAKLQLQHPPKHRSCCYLYPWSILASSAQDSESLTRGDDESSSDSELPPLILPSFELETGFHSSPVAMPAIIPTAEHPQATHQQPNRHFSGSPSHSIVARPPISLIRPFYQAPAIIGASTIIGQTDTPSVGADPKTTLVLSVQ